VVNVTGSFYFSIAIDTGYRLPASGFRIKKRFNCMIQQLSNTGIGFISAGYMGIIVEFIRELNITMKDMKWTSLPVTGRSHFALQALQDRRGCDVRGRSKRAGDGVRDANACRIKLTKGILVIFLDKGTILTYIVCSKTKTNSRIIYHGCSNSR